MIGKSLDQQQAACLEASAVIAKMRADVVYRLPSSGKPLAYIVLTREEAETLLAKISKEEEQR